MERFYEMNIYRRSTPRRQMSEIRSSRLGVLGSTMDTLLRRKKQQTDAAESSSSFMKHTEAPEEDLAHGKNIVATRAKENIRMPTFNLIRELEPLRPGPEAKSPGKSRQIARLHKMYPKFFCPGETMTTMKDIEETLPHIVEAVRIIYQVNCSDILERMSPSKVDDETRMFKSAEKDTSSTEVTSESPEATIDNEAQLKVNIIDAVLESITSTSFKDQLTQRIIREIDVGLAKVISQVREQQLALRFDSARDQFQNISQEQPLSDDGFMPGFSDGVASMIRFSLIEVREELKNKFRSQSNSEAASPAVFDATSDIVDSVFKDIFNSLMPMGDDTFELPSPPSCNEPEVAPAPVISHLMKIMECKEKMPTPQTSRTI
ncbi:uncharacterized protein LOC124384855 isoform X2 [Silurus meridionalis]|uniref:uncharacterized protein LOC124384855 isoform X2 n=1 Tax=Silurus meridionalis TaxID=175797 RepID=UPI001EEAD21B|nr:uncharacterized protein LOC124384855 isoform X2 [Silurus meridionalis]